MKEYNFFMLFLNVYTGLGYFIRTAHINWLHKLRVDLINERQQETHGLMKKKKNYME